MLTRNITVAPVNDAPVLAGIEGTALGYTENQAATAITATLTASDVDNANLAGATIQITANYQNGQDVLCFANTATITGSWNAATGTLTLSGSDTVANYQAALRAVKYQNTSENPSGADPDGELQGQRRDGGQQTVRRGTSRSRRSTTRRCWRAIEGTALAYTENDAATAITATITASDVDNANLAGATVQITGNYQNGQDVLSLRQHGHHHGQLERGHGHADLERQRHAGQLPGGLAGGEVPEHQREPQRRHADGELQGQRRRGGQQRLTRTSRSRRSTTRRCWRRSKGRRWPTRRTRRRRPSRPRSRPATWTTRTLAGATVQITGNYQNGQDVLSLRQHGGHHGELERGHGDADA